MVQITKDTVQAKLREYIQENLVEDDTPVEPDSDLIISGLIDSLDIVHLITFVQTEFQITIPPTDITVENFSTIRTISDYVEQQSP